MAITPTHRLFISLFGALCLSACGGDDSDSSSSQSFVETPPVVEQEAPATTFALNIEAAAISGDYLLDGEPYTNPNANSAVFLENASIRLMSQPNRVEEVFLGYFSDASFEVSVINKSYVPEYSYETATLTPFQPNLLAETNEVNALPIQFVGTASPNTPRFTLSTTVTDNTLPLNYAESLEDNSFSVTQNHFENIDVSTVEISPVFTLNGQSFPTAPQEVAHLYLQSTNSETLIDLGATNTLTNPLTIIPGEYTIIYRYVSGNQIPTNTYKVIANNVVLTSSEELNIAIESSTVRSEFLVNGESFPNSAYDYGHFYLIDSEQQDSVFLGRSYEGLTSVQVINGTYNAHYQGREFQSEAPQNKNAIIREDIVVENGSLSLSLDVEAVQISGSFFVNGTTPPVSAYDYGRIYLVDSRTGSKLMIGNTYEVSYSPLLVITGVYDLEYERRELNGVMPNNPSAIFQRGLDINAARTVDVDLPVVTISSNLTLNGNDFPLSAYNYGHIYLANTDSEEAFYWSETYNVNSSSIRVIPGTYSFYYRLRESTGDVPYNSNFEFISGAEIESDQTITYDFITQNIRIAPTLNNAAFSNSPYTFAHIHIGTSETDRILTNVTNLDPIERHVVVGDYDVIYSFMESATPGLIPVNQNSNVANISVEE
ncbi:hypothetical protein [Aurantivibrio plasticivorans]